MLKDQTLITLFHRNFKIHDELGVHRNLQNRGNVTKFLDEIEGTGENTLGETYHIEANKIQKDD
jgi:hypothetical protein